MFLLKNHNGLIVAYAAAFTWSILAMLIFVLSLPSFRDEDEDGNNDRNRDRPEALAIQRLMLCPILTVISTLGLGFMVWWYLLRKKDAGGYQIGLLGGSTLLYAAMAFISFLYFINFQPPEEEENRSNDNRFLEEEEEEEEWDEEAEILYRQGVLRSLCLVTAILYTLFSLFIVWKYKSFGKSNTLLSNNDESGTKEVDVETRTRRRAVADVFADAWKAISASSILLLFVSFIVVMSSLFGEEGERAREEGNIYNLIWIVGYVFVVSLFFLIAGRLLIFGEREKNNFFTGVFHGGILFFGVSLSMVAILYGNFFQFEERRREEMRGSLGISLVCSFLAILHFMFAFGMIKYQPHVLAEKDESSKNKDASSYVELT